MTNAEIRRKILQILYESFKDHPYGRITPKELLKNLNINLKLLHFNAIYLEEKGLIELQKPLEGSLFVGARATPKGIDIVEDEYQLNMYFPTGNTAKEIAATVFANFTRLIDDINNSDKLNEGEKEIIIEEINEVQDELKNSEPSYSRVKKSIDRLKERSPEWYDRLLVILKDPTVTHFLSVAARKELGI
jgi:predicted transcriptional regulator